MRRICRTVLAAPLVALFCATAVAAEEKPLLQGAVEFIERCVLCHGNLGMGEGLLPTVVEQYPSTNLYAQGRDIDPASVKAYLNQDARNRHALSPPWLQELSTEDKKRIAAFTAMLIEDKEQGQALLDEADGLAQVEISLNRGDTIFRTRCKVCHGEDGEGDGMLSKVVQDPPPFDLTLSRMPDEYLFKIIKQGGAEMGRSPSMPAWGGDLTDSDIQSLILKLKALRRPPSQ